MSYLGLINPVIAPGNGTVTPATISQGGPSWDTSGNVTLTGNITLNNGVADGAQLTLNSAGYSAWNWDNYSGRLRAYYGAAEYFTIDTSGNVGIGTSSPQQQLHLNGGGAFRCSNSANTSGFDVGLLGGGADPAVYMYQRANSFIAIGTNNTERARIDSSGNLLVGTTTRPTGIDKTVIGFNADSQYCLTLYDTSSAATARMATFYKASGERGNISTTSTTTAYNTSSDYRLKENIVPMTGALSVVAALKPCTYTWKVDGSDGQGFIAHELAEVVPDCVSGEKDAVNEDGSIKPQSIDTSFLVATLTAAIQEQQAQISSQASVITTLTERIAALEAK